MSEEVVGKLKKSLEDGFLEDAKALFSDEGTKKVLVENVMEVVPVICEYLSDQHIFMQPELIPCSQELLGNLVESASRKEMLLALLEQMEAFEDDVKFETLLDPLSKLVPKVLGDRNALPWIAGTLYQRIRSLPNPQNYSFEGKERILLDCDSNVQRLVNTTERLCEFYSPLTAQVTKYPQYHSIKPVMVAILLQFFAKPLSVLDLQMSEPKSDAMALSEKLVSLLASLSGDFFQFLEICKSQKEAEGDIEVEDLSLATLFYLCLSENVCRTHIPLPYDPLHVFQCILPFLRVALSQQEEFVVQKGLSLGFACLSALNASQLTVEFLDHPDHYPVLDGLTNVMVFHPAKESRQQGVKCFESFLMKFDLDAQHLLFLALLTKSSQSGFKGYLIGLLKSSLIQALKLQPPHPLFVSQQLWKLLELVFTLPSGVETSILDNYDHIIAALNLLIFLCLRDRCNETGIWDHTDTIVTNFTEPLRTDLKFSQLHHQSLLRDPSKLEAATEPMDVNVLVQGEPLPQLPPKEQKDVLANQLNAFDLIFSILVRAEECMQARPSLA